LAPVYHPDEFLASEDLAWLVVREDLQRLVKKYERQVRKPLCLLLVLSSGPEDRPTGRFSGKIAPDSENEPIGELRLRFRRTVRHDRVLYCAEAHFLPDSVLPGSGFTGFHCSGEVLGLAPDLQAKSRGTVTNLYNHPEWSGWLW
jgi:hypothetical protein